MVLVYYDLLITNATISVSLGCLKKSILKLNDLKNCVLKMCVCVFFFFLNEINFLIKSMETGKYF